MENNKCDNCKYKKYYINSLKYMQNIIKKEFTISKKLIKEIKENNKKLKEMF